MGRYQVQLSNYIVMLFLSLQVVFSHDLAIAAEASKTPDRLPAQKYNYAEVELPAHFSAPEILERDNTPADNPTTDAGATLGRVLFYDKSLSSDSRVSCGSCHQQEHGFGNDLPLTAPIGVGGATTSNHTPALANIRFKLPPFGAEFPLSNTLETQSLLAFTNSREMGNSSIAEVVSRVRQAKYYESLFVETFGDGNVTSERIAAALAQFMRAMLSYSSKFDEGVAIDFANFTTEEKLGMSLFGSARTGCSECHETKIHSMKSGIQNSGVSTANNLSPGLRNVANRLFFNKLGSHRDLKSVLRHYNRTLPTCGQPGSLAPPPCDEASPPLKDPSGQFLQMNLTDSEEDAIISFLKTLSDPAVELSKGSDGSLRYHPTSLLFEDKFSDPFYKLSTDTIKVRPYMPAVITLLE